MLKPLLFGIPWLRFLHQLHGNGFRQLIVAMAGNWRLAAALEGLEEVFDSVFLDGLQIGEGQATYFSTATGVRLAIVAGQAEK